MTVQFEVGKTYQDRAAGDWDMIYSWVVVARTAKTITITERNKPPKRRGVYVYEGTEWCKPDGTYSMCPVIRADRETV